MLVNNFLEQSAQKYPDKPAVWFTDAWITYSQIEAKANQVANFLVDKKISRGDRVAILYDNSFEYIIAYYAILKAGAATVALNTDVLAQDLVYLLNDCGAKALIMQNKFWGVLNKAVDKLPLLETVICEQLPGQMTAGKDKEYFALSQIYETQPVTAAPVRMIDLDLASIIYTSGSTGKPKGVVLSHLNIVTNTRSIIEYLGLTADDRVMVILPFPYVYGKSLLNTHFAVGGAVVMDNRFAYPNTVLETMKRTECTGFAGVPSTFSILLNKSVLKKYSFPKLRYVTQAGGPMAPAIQKEVAIAFYPASLYIMYGATEASARLSYLDPKELPKRWGSIGKAIPNVDLFVADQEGRALPPEEIGEIVARGANIMRGYWNDPEETGRVLKNGLYFTGDIGKMDREGYLYVVGRSKDMIKTGANRVSAKEIEEKILEYTDIHEVAVIGIGDEILGEAIKAFVVSKPNNTGVSEAAVIGFCKKVLPAYKIPKYVEFVDALPKNASGKVLKHKLTTNNKPGENA